MDMNEVKSDLRALNLLAKQFKPLARLPEMVEFLDSELARANNLKNEVASLESKRLKLEKEVEKTVKAAEEEIKALQDSLDKEKGRIKAEFDKAANLHAAKMKDLSEAEKKAVNTIRSKRDELQGLEATLKETNTDLVATRRQLRNIREGLPA